MKRAAFLLVLLAFLGLSPAQTPQAFAQCGTPIPAGTPVPASYEDIVLGVQSAHLLAYFPLSETSGTVANDVTGLVGDGTYSGVTLNATTFVNGEPAPSFDGINDIIDIYSTSLRDAFGEQEGSAMAWVKITNWADANYRGILRLGNGTSNYVRLIKLDSGTQITYNYVAAGTTEGITQNTSSNTGWLQLVITWSKTADTVQAFYNGSSIGTSTSLGTWNTSNTLSSGYVAIGGNTTSQFYFLGSIAHVAIWNTPLTSTEVATLYDVTPASSPTPTAQPTCTYYIELTTPAGQPARVAREIRIADYPIILLLIGLLVSLWGMYLVNRLRGGR